MNRLPHPVTIPLPLKRELAVSQPYPVDCLGPVLGPAVNRLVEVIQAPAALCAQSVLAAATLAVQSYRDVEIDGRKKPLSNFFLTVGASGERKSATDDEALRAHREFERDLARKYKDDLKSYELISATYKRRKEEFLKEVTMKSKRPNTASPVFPGDLSDEPLPPLLPMLIIEEPTYEGLIKALIRGQPSIGLFTDEGGRFIGGHGMNGDNQLKTSAGICELWDGKRISRVRAGETADFIEGRRLSLHLMMQPGVAFQLLGNHVLQDQGLLSRCLTTFPSSTAGSRLYNSVDLTTDSVMRCYLDRMRYLLCLPKPIMEGERNVLQPPAIFLSSDAKRHWIEVHNAIGAQIGEGMRYAPIRGFANKAAEHSLRLAAVLTLVDEPDAPAISPKKMQDAVYLIEFYLEEALRLFHSVAVCPELETASSVLQWIKNRGDQYVHLATIYQYGPNAVRTADSARKVCALLEDHGYLVRMDPIEIDGALRQEVWRVSFIHQSQRYLATEANPAKEANHANLAVLAELDGAAFPYSRLEDRK